MNTVKSFWVGWGALCVAGGTAYYFAKQSINADRQTRYEEHQKQRRINEALEHSQSNRQAQSASSKISSTPRKIDKSKGGPPPHDHSGSPSQEATSDPAPTRHAPESEGQQVREKSKYEASEPYRSRKGDRFS